MASVDERRNRVSKYRSGHNGSNRGRRMSDEQRAKLAAITGERVSSYKHGWSRTPTYVSWRSMWNRCTDSRNASWSMYGGRGITVCERWRDFVAFLEDMGERPSMDHSIDRVEVDGNYEPSNCRWLTRAEQNARRKDPGGWVRRRANRAT